MEILFATTSDRKKNDLQHVIDSLEINIKVKTYKDIGWIDANIEENGKSLSENSLIKAEATRQYCLKNGFELPIISDDAGLFCDAIGGEPGIYTSRYAEKEMAEDPTLPPYQGIVKLLNKMHDKIDRTAYYRCVVTYMEQNGEYFQVQGESKGKIANGIVGKLIKPYQYSIFMLDGMEVPLNDVTDEKILMESYRYKALRQTILKIANKWNEK